MTHLDKIKKALPEQFARHTVGKWDIWTNDEGFPFIMGEDRKAIAELYFNIPNTSTFETSTMLFGGRALEETQANAKLIAAAPMLLQALRELLAETEDENETTEFAKQVIKKATL